MRHTTRGGGEHCGGCQRADAHARRQAGPSPASRCRVEAPSSRCHKLRPASGIGIWRLFSLHAIAHELGGPSAERAVLARELQAIVVLSSARAETLLKIDDRLANEVAEGRGGSMLDRRFRTVFRVTRQALRRAQPTGRRACRGCPSRDAPTSLTGGRPILARREAVKSTRDAADLKVAHVREAIALV